MPTVQDIEQFKTILNTLGDEPEILAERGEEIEDLKPGELGLPEGLSDLLEGGEAAGPEAGAPGAAAPPAGFGEVSAEEEIVDLGDLLGEEELAGLDILEGVQLPEEEPAAPAEEALPEETVPAAEEAPPEEAEAFDFELPEEPVAAQPQEEPEAAELEAEPEVEAAPEADEFQIPPGLLEAAAGPAGEETPLEEIAVEEVPPEDLPEMPGFEPEAFEVEGPEAAKPAEAAFGEETFELPEEFQLPEEEPVQELPEEELPVEAAAEEAAAGPSEEEADFLKILQEEIFPGEEAAVEEAAPEAAVVPPPEEALSRGEQIDLEAPAGVPEAAEEFHLDEFSLEGLGEAFEEERPVEEIPVVEPGIEEEIPEEITVPVAEELTFTEKQFLAIKNSLSRLPRNLKMAIEELIAEKGLAGEELRSLLALLVEGAAPAAIAELTSRLAGRRIVLPRSYARLTGLAFVEERGTFAYAFRQNILPILRVAVLSLAFLGLLGFLGYSYVYRPLYANFLYRQGYSQIAKQRYRMANDTFQKATAVWAFKSWFYRYASAFTREKQYQLAAEKYEQLLDPRTKGRWPGDRRGILSYAALLTFHLAGYEQADKLLNQLLVKNMRDYDALLAQGDNFLEWAQEDESRYAEARFAYATIIDYHGERDEVLTRMMRYFIRTDKYEETLKLKRYLDGRRRAVRIEAQLAASTYAELAGYWLDKGNYDQITGILFRALDAKKDEPEIHYQLARYYRHVSDPGQEEMALDEAIRLLEKMQPLDKRHLLMVIDSYNRRGETYWRRGQYLEAEDLYRKSIDRIEGAQAQRIVGRQQEFGLVYKNYGDIYYYIGHKLEAALSLYLKAEVNRYSSPDLDYKIGYIHYVADRHEEALEYFAKVVDDRPTNANALYALANSLYQRSYYSAAQGYYLRLLNLLEAREKNIPFLQIYDNPEHAALVEYIMKVFNNLGVTLKQLGDRSRDPDKESKALVNMTYSSERFDQLSRDRESLERGVTKNLAYLNQRGILYPTSDFRLQIYPRLPVDLEAVRF